MKVDEVMLGDIVSVSGRPIHVTLAVLNTWSDNIKPIQLTPEILEKNGFRKVKNNCNYIIHNTLIFNTFTLALCTYDYNSIIPYNTICYCHYIHELQHLLKLCKIDKEIVI